MAISPGPCATLRSPSSRGALMSLSRRLSRHWAARVGIAAVSLALVGVSSMGAQTIGGSLYGGSGGTGCDPGMWVQTSSVAGTDGVLTSWSLGDLFTSAKLKVVRPATGNLFDVVAEAGPATPGTHLTRILVRQGDQVGVSTQTTQQACPRTDSDPSATSGYHAGDPAAGTRSSYTATGNLEIPLTAQVEPDADHDGYGDETQDQCPTNGATAGPCPLPTVLGRTFAPDVSLPCTGTYLPTATLGRVGPSALGRRHHLVVAPGCRQRERHDEVQGLPPARQQRLPGRRRGRSAPGDSQRAQHLPGPDPGRGRRPDRAALDRHCGACPTSRARVVKTPRVPEDPAVGTPITTSGANSRNLDLSAVLEPDADDDGYGDVSQDGCPSQAGTAGACRDLAAPDTSFKKAPKKTVTDQRHEGDRRRRPRLHRTGLDVPVPARQGQTTSPAPRPRS